MSVIVEALAGAIGSGCSLDAKGFGHTFMAIDPTGYCSLDEFTERIDSMIDHIKSSRKRPGFEEILYPGEPEWLEEVKRRKLGILVDDPLWENIIKSAKDLNVNIDRIMMNGFIS